MTQLFAAETQRGDWRRAASRWLRWGIAILILIGFWQVGGRTPGARAILTAGVVILGLVAVMVARPQVRMAPWWWPLGLAAPLVALVGLQIAPVGLITQPAPVALTGWDIVPPNWVSHDPVNSIRAAIWAVVVASWGVLLGLVFRGRYSSQLAMILIVVASLQAGWAVLESLLGLVVTRANGSFVYPNHLAAHVASALGPACYLGLRPGRYDRRWITCAAILVLGLLVSGSRIGVVLGLASGLAGWLLAGGRVQARRVGLAVVGGLVFALAVLVGQHVWLPRWQGASEQVASLNGRVEIWTSAASLMADRPLGSGVGTAGDVFRQGGLALFEPAPIRHLHSDVMELLVECGWIGAILLFGVWVSVLAKWVRPSGPAVSTSGSGRRDRWRLGMLGAAPLVLHACADHILLAEMLTWQIVAWLVIACQTRAGDQPVSSSRWRWSMASLVVILAISLVWQVRWERERLAVQAVTPWLMDVDDGRRHQPDQAVEGLLAIQAPQLLKAVQARLACQLRLEDTPPDVLLLRQAMARSPWQAELWATALAIQLQQADDRLPSISRLADGLAGLAPTWQQGQHLRWEALGQRRDPGMADALARLLADGSPLTLHRCRLATRAIGHHAWHEHLQAAWSSLSETDRDQLWPWVVEHGSLAFAQAAWSGRDPGPLSPWQATLGSAAPVNSWSDARLVGCAVGLTSAALPLPEGLRAALQQRGDPVAVWADPPRVDAVGYWTDRQARLRPHRFISWVGEELTRCRAWLAALRGSQDVLTTRPELAGWALTNADAVLRPRLLAYLHRQGVYRLVPQRGIVVETRVWDRPELAPVIRCPQWCMLIINGQPIGWKRGPVPLGTLTEPGWHRVVQVALP